jgi:SAM-dependent methyltransferase
MIKIPSVEDWFNLTRIYPQFRKVSNTALKDYGYMEVFKYLDDHSEARNILEFGHGFNLELFKRYGETRNVWGADAWQGLHYFPAEAEWAKEMERQISGVPNSCTFRNCLLGAQNATDLPEAFFDVVCSISVLEEVPIEKFSSIIEHASRLLRPGGVLIGTQDFCLAHKDRLHKCSEIQREYGLDIEDPPDPLLIDDKTLVENPTMAMLFYQDVKLAHEQGYFGHWSTLWSVAIKQ